VNMNDKLAAASEGLRVMQALQGSNSTMEYNVFGRLVGIIPNGEPWHIKYRNQIADTLRFMAVIVVETGGKIAREKGEEGYEFWRFVAGSTGEPGGGLYKGRTLQVNNR
jgi:hypothetical protein